MTIFAWVIFLLIIGVLLALDLGVINKTQHEYTTAEALKMTALWIGCALVFGVLVVVAYNFDWFQLRSSSPDKTICTGYDAGLQYITGYLIEKALSMDNIFVMAMLFTCFILGHFRRTGFSWCDDSAGGCLGEQIFVGDVHLWRVADFLSRENDVWQRR